MLAEQIVLGLPYIKNRDDGLALWGVLSRNGGLGKGNLKFRLADVMCANSKKGNRISRVLVPLLQEVGALDDGEFVMELMKVSLMRGTDEISKKVLSYPRAAEHILGDAAQYLLMPLRAGSPATRLSSLRLLLSSLDFTQTAKDEALGRVALQAMDKSGHDQLHECFSCLIEAGANPTVMFAAANPPQTPQTSIALFIATRASSFYPKGADFLRAMIKSPHWPAVLEDESRNGFAWNWYNSDGDTNALLEGLEALPIDWWKADHCHVFSSALMEAQEGDSPLFDALKNHLRKKTPQKSIPLSDAISIAEDAIRLACENCENDVEKPKKGFSILDQILGTTRPNVGEVKARMVSFWGVKAPLIAPAFEDPKEWRSLCLRVSNLLERSNPAPSSDQMEAFLEGWRLENATRQPLQISPSRTRRI